MNVIGLTVFLGLVLVTFFICLFFHQHASPGGAASERDALMPLEEEKNSASTQTRTPKQ